MFCFEALRIDHRDFYLIDSASGAYLKQLFEYVVSVVVHVVVIVSFVPFTSRLLHTSRVFAIKQINSRDLVHGAISCSNTFKDCCITAL